MAITQNHIINIQPGVSAPLVIHCSQGDTGTQINLTVVNGDETFDCSSYACSVHGVRSDGGNWGPITCTVSGSTVCFSLTSAMTAVAGACLAEISVGTVGTANFAILVENATFSLGVTYTEDVSLYQSILSYNMGAVQNIKAEATAGVNKAIDQMNANTNAINAKYDAATTNFNQGIATAQNQYAVTNAKLDTAISAATQDSEVQDIRVKADGTSATTAGNAVREQITDLKDALDRSIVAEYNGKWEAGYVSADGTVSYDGQGENNNKISQAIATKSVNVSIKFSKSHDLWFGIGAWANDGSFLERKVYHPVISDKLSFSYTAPEGTSYVRISYRAYDEDYAMSVKYYYVLKNTVETIRALTRECNDNISTVASLANFSGRFKPCYDHLFVEDGSNSVIPHESLYHVRLSRRFGFNTIEANIAKTSDGVFIVTHLYEGAFWNWFHHVDGKTDISTTLVSSVTWDWIVKNVRYNSTIKKYQTRPCRLEEFLSECRQQNIIPFIYTEDVNVLAMADEYMGKDNYIAYGANRANAPTAIIYHWAYETSKEAILSHCEKVGKPFIYGMGNPTAFTDSELKEIVDAVHSAGYWIGTSYADPMWYKYSYIGFDFNGTQTRINRIDNGNICNLSSAFGFDEFEVVNGAEADGILTFSSNGTISPNVPSTVFPFCGIDLQIDFTGTIVVPTIGKHARTQYTSDGSMPFFVAVPILNGSPHLTVEVMSGTIIRDLSFKASKF